MSFALLILCAAALRAAQPTPLETGYRQMYNLQFEEAHRTFAEWQRQHPEDPMGPVSDAAAYLFAEFDRLHILQAEFFTKDEHFFTDRELTPDPHVKRQFDAALARAHALANRNPQDNDSIFASIMASGLRSDYMALIEKKYRASLKEMKAARLAAERLLAADPAYCDAWIAIGVENYMLGSKPLVMRWFLRMAGSETNREKGIEKLRLAAAKGRYLAPFARLLLAVVALRGENRAVARDLLTGLAREFPHNRLFTDELAQLTPGRDSSAR